MEKYIYLSSALMRIPTFQEWDALMDVVQEKNKIAHWKYVSDWVSGAAPDCMPEGDRAYRGMYSARFWGHCSASLRSPIGGFRPAFDTPGSDSSPIGTVACVGTLYMGNEPVFLRENRRDRGDVADYEPNAKLVLREAIKTEPLVQLHAIKVTDTLWIANRSVLKNISYDDLESALA